MRATRAILVLVIVLATGVLLGPMVRAEHAPDHRYFIVGTITDELGEPRPAAAQASLASRFRTGLKSRRRGQSTSGRITGGKRWKIHGIDLSLS